MCQAIVKPAGISIEKRILKNAWDDNPNGAGMAIRKADGSVVVAKGYMKFKKFWQAYKKVESQDLLIHFRLATTGKVDGANCHPFVIAPNAALIHNGIMRQFDPPLKGDTRSDTRYFCEAYLSQAIKESGLSAYEFLHNPAGKALIEVLTAGQKIACLTPEGFTIFGERRGEWKNGAWYSAGYPNESLNAMWKSGWYNKMITNYYKSGTGDNGPYKPYIVGGQSAQVDPGMSWQKDIRGHHAECSLCGAEGEAYKVGSEDLCNGCWSEYVG